MVQSFTQTTHENETGNKGKISYIRIVEENRFSNLHD